MTASTTPAEQANLPPWATELVTLYESNAASQFLLHGNVGDRLVLPLAAGPELGSLTDFLMRVLLPRFDVILGYDLGNGLRVEQGGKIFAEWPRAKENPDLPRNPNAAVETLTHYFRYCGNLSRLRRERAARPAGEPGPPTGSARSIACIVRAADLVAPAFPGGLSYDLSALALLIRDWATETLMTEQHLATFLLVENLNDLHPQIVANSRAARIEIPLPAPEVLEQAFRILAPAHPRALAGYQDRFEAPARQLAGATLSSVESMLKTREYAGNALTPGDLVQLKKRLVEKDCNGLIEFIESSDNLDSLHGQERLREWLEQDIALWAKNDIRALPMGYLLCGPVGTGKTFMVKCLAGQAGVPVVKLKNFRDKWVGSSEGNLEKIFRLLHALGRCFVFIDEADQALGKRDSGSDDSGISGRLYSMMAEEMSNPANRGRIIWILASSRPDLIEVDLKRPGRIDVKIPLFPTTNAREAYGLLASLARRRGIELPESGFQALESLLPPHLTPGAAEVLAVKIYRMVQVEARTPMDALRECLDGYRNPVAAEVMDFQIGLAVDEASDMSFVPDCFRKKQPTQRP